MFNPFFSETTLNFSGNWGLWPNDDNRGPQGEGEPVEKSKRMTEDGRRVELMRGFYERCKGNICSNVLEYKNWCLSKTDKKLL